MGYNQLSIKILGCAYTGLILSVHFTSAGLLQAIREAAVPKDMDYQLPAEIESSSVVPSSTTTEDYLASASDLSSQKQKPVVTLAEESNLFATLQNSLSKLSSAIQERADVAKTSYGTKKSCNPGDIFCLSGITSGNPTGTLNNEISKAIIKSFGTMMSDMVNATISRSLVDFMSKHGHAHGESLAEEQKAMMTMTTNALQTVSSTVIKSLTIFLQMAISGSMRGLLHTVIQGANKLLLKVSETTKQNGPQGDMMLNENEIRTLFGSPEKFPKPSQLEQFDPVKTILQAGALTALSFPNPSGFDLVTSLKSNLFDGDTNSIDRKSGVSPIFTPNGLVRKR